MTLGNLPKGVDGKGCFLKEDKSQNAQAISELAIIGSLILLGFATLLSYAQSMNSQQSLQMKAFRRALARSRSENKVVSYTIVKDSPVIDIKDLFGRPDTNRQVASNTICAIRKDPYFANPESKDDRESAEYYEINGNRYLIEPIKIRVRFDEDKYETWIPAPIRDVEYLTQKIRQGQLSKTESRSSISTTRSGSVTATDNTILVLEDKGIFEANYLRDLRDKVEEQPWEKKLGIETRTRNFAGLIEFLISGVASALIGKYEEDLVSFLGDVFGKEDLGCCGGPSITVKAALYGGSQLILSVLLNGLFNKSTAEGRARAVDVVAGYRSRDTISGRMGFTTGGSLSASH
ncbi:MAG: hypothetical protein NC912_03775 [Candidatus Omnitrophica bacterium]|nr:hypothetical protein [Candidatus Omnitrophota bacterium]